MIPAGGSVYGDARLCIVERGIEMKWASQIIVFVSLLTALGCGSEGPPPPEITQEEMSLAIEEIESDPIVQDAAIQQQGRTLSLAVIVTSGTSRAEAKEVGDRFVRLVKTLSKDAPPGNDVGAGIYDYLIGVYYPGQVEVVSGAKASIARSITW
jgi:hypothetical protein